MRKIYINLLICILSFSSCQDWLDVQPKTAISAEDLFNSENGFKDVLTGFYLKMAAENIYARQLTYGYLELIAGNYDNYPGLPLGDTRKWYEYNGEFKSVKDGIYLGIYEIIANINNFLYYIDANREVIVTKDYYEIMKGEALALRAFLHFDLLRLFGPIYSKSSSALSISYRTTFDLTTTPLLSASQVIEHILDDLNRAEELLQDHDPESFGYPETWTPGYNQFLARRQLRMNVWAVRALKARVYCYQGDDIGRKEAVKYAEQVIENGPCSLVKSNEQSSVLYAEILFGLSVYDFEKIFDAMLAIPSTNTIDDRFSLSETRFNMLYELDFGNSTDIRANDRAFNSYESYLGVYKFCQKYNPASNSEIDNGRNVLPLIRLSEMYYIIAECEINPDLSVEALNEVRIARGIPFENEVEANEDYDRLDYRDDHDTSKTKRINELMKEYGKEFYGEGQLFYFYKRHDYLTFQGCPLDNVREYYQWPIPDNEKLFGHQ